MTNYHLNFINLNQIDLMGIFSSKVCEHVDYDCNGHKGQNVNQNVDKKLKNTYITDIVLNIQKIYQTFFLTRNVIVHCYVNITKIIQCRMK